MKPQQKWSIFGEWDIVGDAPKPPAGAIGVVQGDFFPQVGGQDVGFVKIRYFGTFSPIYILLLLFQVCIGIPVVRGR
jgi:hypothetical protein